MLNVYKNKILLISRRFFSIKVIGSVEIIIFTVYYFRQLIDFFTENGFIYEAP